MPDTSLGKGLICLLKWIQFGRALTKLKAGRKRGRRASRDPLKWRRYRWQTLLWRLGYCSHFSLPLRLQEPQDAEQRCLCSRPLGTWATTVPKGENTTPRHSLQPKQCVCVSSYLPIRPAVHYSARVHNASIFNGSVIDSSSPQRCQYHGRDGRGRSLNCPFFSFNSQGCNPRLLDVVSLYCPH